ncbi:MAG TPA: HrpB1 family type III secretion system apparatus protein [Ideonella sp.]|jgi:type III secretion protein HrpB1|nr:HrpB1 family type III secretion system apparatus protein [Ideonella sp.]
MNAALEGRAHLAGLVDVLTLAINRGQLDDAEVVLASVRALRPALVELDTFEAWIEMKRNRYAEALRILGPLEAARPNWAVGRALMAYCQFASGDPSWLACAQDVMDTCASSKEAVMLVRVLLDPDSVPMPETAETAQAAAASAPPATPTQLPQGTYLRG